MWFIDLRYTFRCDKTSDASSNLLFMKEIKKVLLPYIIDNTYTGSIENKNKLGEDTKTHIHFRFTTETPIVTIRRQFVRRMINEYNDFRKLSKNIYYIKAIPEVDEDKFWRYPFKQINTKMDLNRYAIYSMSEEEADKHREVAYSTWKLGQEINHAKIANKEPTTFIERAFHYVQVSGADKYSSIYKSLIQFYVEQDKPLDANRIKGYTYNYMLKENILTIDEYYDLNN